MAEKDLSQKALIEYPDVFADVFNAMAFGGAANTSGESQAGVYGVCVQIRIGITDQVVK